MKRMIGLFVAVTAALALSVVPVVAAGPNLIDNGDFEEGNSDFDTDFDFADESTQTMHDPLTYTVGPDPNDYHSSWDSFPAHGGDGNMMILNGATPSVVDPLVWGQTVDLECLPVYPESSYTLYAAQDWEVGQVLVKLSDDPDKAVCVQIVLDEEDVADEGWLIVEAHIAVGTGEDDIPQNRTGNPVPGHFEVNEELDPGVDATPWYCLPYDWDVDEDIIVAAHAVIQKVDDYHEVVVSEAGEGTVDLYTTDPENILNPVGTPSSGEPVATWVHPSWPSIPGATWISSASQTEDPVNDSWRLFTRTIELPEEACNIGGSVLTSTADNTEEVALNGAVVGSNGLWATVTDYGLPLEAGENSLQVMVKNNAQSGGTYASNPTGLIYSLEYDYQIISTESAWGDGERFVDRGNWATYIEYSPQVECDYGSYELGFFAASSYSTNPANLAVSVNDEPVGALVLPTTTGEWVEFSVTWDAGSATSARIEIRDTTSIFSGDDFVIDDISFVRQ